MTEVTSIRSIATVVVLILSVLVCCVQHAAAQSGSNDIAGSIYISGSNQILVYQNMTNNTDGGSTTNKCVKYTKGMSPDGDTEACLSQTFNLNGVLIACSLTFNGKMCDQCSVCTTNVNQIKGFSIRCNNIRPTRTNADCQVVSDSVVQSALVDKDFSGVTFNFNTSVPSKGGTSGGGGASVGNTTKKTSNAMNRVVLLQFVSTLLVVPILLF